MPVRMYLLGPSEDEAEESVMERGASLSGQSAVRLVAFLKSAGQVRQQQDICTLQLALSQPPPIFPLLAGKVGGGGGGGGNEANDWL